MQPAPLHFKLVKEIRAGYTCEVTRTFDPVSGARQHKVKLINARGVICAERSERYSLGLSSGSNQCDKITDMEFEAAKAWAH